MNKLTRYLVVAMLVAGLVLDSASACRQYHLSCCCNDYVAASTTCSPSACPTTTCCSPGEVIATEFEPVVSGSPCQTCPIDTAESAGAEEPLPPQNEEATSPQEAPFPLAPEPSEPAPAESTNTQPAVPAVPVRLPEPSGPIEAETPTPTFEEPPTETLVGDRYGSAGETLEGPVAQESTPAPVNESESDETDIFGEPLEPSAETTPETPQPESESITTPPIVPEPEAEIDDDDIFGPAKSDSAGYESGSPELPGDETEEFEAPEPSEPEDIQDPFGSFPPDYPAKILAQSGGLQSETSRVWTDNTANFRCEARLVNATPSGITLQKSSGTQLKVPLTRLSTADLQFVHQQVTALRVARVRDAATQKLAVTWAD